MPTSPETDLYGAMSGPTPCRRYPTVWDADRGTPFDVIRELVRQCRTECPVFAACAKYAATQPPVTGVLAGQYIPHENGRSLAKAFFAELRARILQGEFLPGDAMPSEEDLHRTTGCDPRTIAAAYKALERAGFVSRKTVRGATIRIVRSVPYDSAA